MTFVQVPSILPVLLGGGQVCLAFHLPGHDLRLPEEGGRRPRVQVLGARGLREAVSQTAAHCPPAGLADHAPLP